MCSLMFCFLRDILQKFVDDVDFIGVGGSVGRMVIGN